MARFHQINGELVQFTAEEEIQRDAEIAAWVAGENDRAMAALRQDRLRPCLCRHLAGWQTRL